jgi:hypothetical protein
MNFQERVQGGCCLIIEGNEFSRLYTQSSKLILWCDGISFQRMNMKRSGPKVISRRDASRTSSMSKKIQTILRCVAFVPWAVLLLERLWDPLEGPMSGYLHVENVAATTTQKWAFQSSSSTTTSLQSFPDEYPLQRITQNYRGFEVCPQKTEKLSNVIVPLTVGNAKANNGTAYTSRSIPNILHLAVDKKCASSELHHRVEQWKQQSPEWSIYIHDEEAMVRLLRLPAVATEFPQLHQIVRNCLLPSRDVVTLTKLWKYLVLYIYGGLYLGMDFAPAQQVLKGSLKDQEAVVAVQRGEGPTHTTISSAFLMAPPHHPLLFYALHHALQDLAQGRADGENDARELDRAFLDFRGEASGNIAAGSHKGFGDHTVTVLEIDGEDQSIKHQEERFGRQKKAAQKNVVSCRESILMEVLDGAKIG